MSNARACGLDGNKAYVLGLLHDIGRFEGPRGLHHVVAGHTLMQEKGYACSARICLTHSFPVPALASYSGKNDCSPQETETLATLLAAAAYDEYDHLIQLCDAMCLPAGVCLLDVRLMDVVRRHGFNSFTLQKWDAAFALKAQFDTLCGKDVYDLFYDEVRAVSFRQAEGMK